MALLHSGDKKIDITITPEIWPAVAGDFRCAIIDLSNGFSLSVDNQEEYQELYQQMFTAGNVLGWLPQ